MALMAECFWLPFLGEFYVFMTGVVSIKSAVAWRHALRRCVTRVTSRNAAGAYNSTIDIIIVVIIDIIYCATLTSVLADRIQDGGYRRPLRPEVDR